MSIAINANPRQKSSGRKSVDFPNFLKLADNLRTGFSKQPDGSTDSNGTLYPTNFNNSAGLGSLQTKLTADYSSAGGYTQDTGVVANNGSVVKTAEAWTNLYRRWKYITMKVAQALGLTVSGITTNNLSIMKVVPIDSTRAFIMYTDSSIGLRGVVGTLAAAGTWTFGSSTTLDANFVSNGYSSYMLTGCLINTDKIFAGWRVSGGGADCYVITFSGSTITVGSVANRTTGAAVQQMASTKLATDKVMLTWNANPNNEYAAATVATTTITHGTKTAIASTDAAIICQADGTDKALMYYMAGTAAKAISVTWSGTTPTAGSAVTVFSSAVQINGNQNGGISYGDQVGFLYGCLVRLTTDKFMAVNFNTTSKAVIITVSGTTVTVNTQLLLSASTCGQMVMAYAVSAGSDYLIYAGTLLNRLAISGTTITETSYDTATEYSADTNVTNNLYLFFMSTTICVFGQPASYSGIYYYTGGTGSIEIYSDVSGVWTLITTATISLQLAASTVFIDYAINATKAHLKLKNVSGATRTITITEVMAEVE